jgi:SWI/SNF-related matrix-associated actin-dependent regulator of chromatin subfamily A3
VQTGLYPHQKEALAWMIQQEHSEALPVFWKSRSGVNGVEYLHTLTNFVSPVQPSALRGGILADDMGLGKTLTSIALIATNRPGAAPATMYTRVVDSCNSNAPGKRSDDNNEEHRPRKKAKPVPSNRSKSDHEEGKGSVQSPVAKDEDAGPIVVPSLGADAPRPTLIVCPLSVLSTWKMQFEEHAAPGALDVFVYYGAERDRRRRAVAVHDVVLTTYNTLVSEAGSRDGLFGVNWLRIIADEAHYVKNAKTQTAKALQKISARFRWALTGTPIQNSLRDLHGLLFYLGVEPLTDHSLFRRTIERPLIGGQAEGLPRLRVLAGSLALRRTKLSTREGVPLVTLPPKEVFIVEVELDAGAREKYQRWEAAGRGLVSRMLAEGTLLLNYTSVLEVLLRLRQICCDPALVLQDEPSFAQSLHAQHAHLDALPPDVVRQLVELLRAGLDDECPICLSEMHTPCITCCRHIFCRRCIELVVERDKAVCPLCRGELSMQHLVELPPETQDEDTAEASAELKTKDHNVQGRTPSAKISMLLSRLNEAWASAPEEKHVVFSQFTSMLDFVEEALRGWGVGCCRIDGRTPGTRREKLIRAFASQDSTSPKVFLISLKAGGVGLNLTAANHVHLLEPWWNPAVEEQAADRIHRLGQRCPVSIHRYVVSRSIEERMLELQEEKRKLMAAAFGMRPTAEEVRATRLRDVRLLMDLHD